MQDYIIEAEEAEAESSRKNRDTKELQDEAELIRLRKMCESTDASAKDTLKIPEVTDSIDKKDLIEYIQKSILHAVELFESINKKINEEIKDEQSFPDIRRSYMEGFDMLRIYAKGPFNPKLLKDKVKECLRYLIEYKRTFYIESTREDIDLAIDNLQKEALAKLSNDDFENTSE